MPDALFADPRLTALFDVIDDDRSDLALSDVGAGEDYRLIGGVSVMLHVQRLGLDLPCV